MITIATEGVYSPFSFHNEKDELMGYDAEIAKAVADKLGLKPKFIEASLDAMLAAFDAGKADTVFNQASITKERKKSATTPRYIWPRTRQSLCTRITTISSKRQALDALGK